jgi:hypothetical protein
MDGWMDVCLFCFSDDTTYLSDIKKSPGMEAKFPEFGAGRHGGMARIGL